MNVYLKNTLRVLYYGWRESGNISNKKDAKKGRLAIYFDIIQCFRDYQTMSFQYSEYEMYNLPKKEKEEMGKELKKLNYQKNHWEDTYDKNWKFFKKYSGLKYNTSFRKRLARRNAYAKRFGFGKDCWVQYGVMFICEHFSVGKLTIGDNVLFARNVDIDYTGDLTIGNDVSFAEGVKVLTHEHDSYHFKKESDLIPFSNRAYKTNLKIGNMVSIGTHAIIMPGVREIGENSIISAGSVVTRPVPPNVIVAGNPATIVRKIPSIVNRTRH